MSRKPPPKEHFDDAELDSLIDKAKQSDNTWPKYLGQAIEQLKAERDALRVTQTRERNMSTTKSSDAGNMFEIATRAKLRFPSAKGEMTTEQLWDIPLRSKDDFNLDVIAKTTNKALKAISEESFVETTKNPNQGRLELALDIVKFIIETKIEEEKAVAQRVANAQEREKLLKILAEKQDGKLSDLSEKELQARIRALGE